MGQLDQYGAKNIKLDKLKTNHIWYTLYMIYKYTHMCTCILYESDKPKTSVITGTKNIGLDILFLNLLAVSVEI